MKIRREKSAFVGAYFRNRTLTVDNPFETTAYSTVIAIYQIVIYKFDSISLHLDQNSIVSS